MNRKKLLPLLLVLSVAWFSQIVTAQTVVYDDSDGPFSLLAQMVTVLSPNGGENWNGGETHNITWSLASSITTVNIDYSTDSGNNWIPVATNTANDGTHAWTVPATISTTCLVRVSEASNAGNNDVSNRVFSISSALTETVTTPGQPSGPASGTMGNPCSFSINGANSNFGDALQYKFDWGDGTDSGWLATGTTSAAHAWATGGTYQVRAMARCATHTSVESLWSETHNIIINEYYNLHKFAGGAADGKNPYGDLILSGTTLYGMTSGGGDNNFGTIFKIETNGTGFMLLHEFAGGAADGKIPYGSLILSGSTLYGMTEQGGDSGWGTIFKIQTNGTGFALLHKFAVDYSDGAGPRGSLIISGSTLFGMVTGGGDNNNGTIFKMETDGTGFELLHKFAGGATDGRIPYYSSLILSGSTLYGVTGWGGDGDYGTIFKIETNGTGFTLLHEFAHDSGSDGAYPFGSLILSGSTLYGMTSGGSGGKIFKIQTNGTGYTLLHGFGSTGDGYEPRGSLILSGSTLYGMTRFGGISDMGTIFKIQTDGSDFISLFRFIGGTASGNNPTGSLILSGSTLYGMAKNGGDSNLGVIFSLPLSFDNITITSPNGSENWLEGSNQNITWGSPGTIANVNIDYSTDSGTSWITVATSIAANIGTFSWTIPSTLSNNCLVRVSDAVNAAVFDVSDAVFTISAAETLTVITPSGGENWISGTVQNITWSSTGTISNVNIDYSTNNGSSWTPVAASIANSGTYAWTVPATPSTTCLVRVSDTANVGTYDVSNGVFTIATAVTATITVISPNGGENWISGNAQNITWSSTGVIINVNIDYSTDNGSSWTPAAANIANNGSYAWTIPATPSLACLVRISDAANAATFDVSDAAFSISPAVENITTPTQPSGPDVGLRNTSFSFSSGGSISSFGHQVQYKFDWGDGSDSGWLAVGTTSADHAWLVGGTYQVRAITRCATNTGVESSWSETHTIIIYEVGMPFLKWSTFLGGSQYDFGRGIAIDNNGNVYVAGSSSSTWGSPLNPYGGNYDAFVAKFNASGALQWNTFLGGNNTDEALSIAVDNNGNIFISGYSYSTWGSPLNPYGGGNCDAFVAKLNANGALQWNTFLGGSNEDYGLGIAFDTSGNIYITGYSISSWGSPIRAYSSGRDGFAAKLNASGALQWNTFLGGINDDYGQGIAVDTSGNIFITGDSSSTWGSPLHPHNDYVTDAFVAKLNADGALQWNTFMGGSDGGNYGQGIAVDSNGNIFISGSSYSTWGSPLNPYNGNEDAFVAKLNASGALQWHTFLGGINEDFGQGITSDSSGNIYIIGGSSSTWGSPLNPYGGGDYDAFVAKLNANGALQWNTFLGGSNEDSGPGISVENNGNIFIAGDSSSTWGNPLNPYNGNDDAFVAKLGLYWSTLIVTSPNGGENWVVGSSKNITWGSPDTIANVNIDCSSDNGSSWTPVATNIANSGTYAWTVPATPSNTCLVRVSDAANAATYDVSDAVFSISTFSTLTISGTITSGGTGLANVVMNGLPGNPTTNTSGFYSAAVDYNWSGTVTPTLAGFTFSPANRTYTNVVADQLAQDYSAALITFTVSGTITSVGTGLANVVMDGLPGNPTTNASGFYTAVVNYNWSGTVTPTLAGCTFTPAYTIYTNLMANQTTNYTATVTPSIVVTSPNGGEQWQRGIAQTITWTSVGVTNVKIQLIKGTAVNSTITNSIPAAGGSYSWTISASQAAGTNYKIRIISKESSAVQDSSNANFTIFAPSITITAPAAGTKWQRGVVHTITWTKEGILDANVMIQLIKGTAVNSTIAATTPNSGSFNWTIPSTQALAANYKIRIKTIDNLVTGNSGKFSITNTPGLTLQAPNGNERLAVRSTYPIRWTVDPSMNEVKLEYSRDNGGTFFTIADHVPNSGQYAWRVPVNFTFNGIIRVSDSLGKNWLDEEGMLECLFKFDCGSRQEARQPDFAVWFGTAKIKSPGYGFAGVSIGRDMVRMAETSRAMAPLSSGWHEAKIRLDLKRDLGTLFIDNEWLLENVALYTSPDHHFEPYLSIRAEGSAAVDLLLAELTVQVTLLSAGGNEKDRFTILSEDFGGYDAKRNVIGNTWQASGLKPDGTALSFKALPGMGQALWLQSVAGAPITIGKSLAIPEKIPFDISDRSFIIEMRQEVD